MLAALRDRGWTVFGSERTFDGARAAAIRNHVTTFVGDFDALGPGPRFRAVILFQVLEHLTDPLSVLRRGAAVLEPGGSMLVAVPNFASWQARLFGPAWFHLDVPRHHHHFSPAALKRALEGAGLRVVSTRFASFEHDPYGWIQSILNRLGFKQNLLTKWLMGSGDSDATPATIVAMLVIGAVLALPSVLLAMCSWAAGAGATMEMRAVKA
jgi:SAM-dependent methyltransferase